MKKKFSAESTCFGQCFHKAGLRINNDLFSVARILVTIILYNVPIMLSGFPKDQDKVFFNHLTIEDGLSGNMDLYG